jgi:hypothetical protein
VGELAEDALAFDLAELLDEELARRLVGDAAERRRLDGLVPVEGADVALDAVDLHDGVLFGVQVLLGGQSESLLDGLEDELLIDALLAVNRVHDSENFAAVHSFFRFWGTPTGDPAETKKSGLEPTLCALPRLWCLGSFYIATII